ncbi:MAG TPA: hypothetical protein VK464_15440 [Symbiobacteriaceae bacterium]|jgi:hypothetical protein|nr:hypothetical protein [Symbiobacteriaceae bacterium]
MMRTLKIAVVAVAATAVLAGVTYAATRPVPEQQPAVALQNPNGLALPGDMKALDLALQAQGPVKYKVLVIDSTDGEDKTAYLDRVAAEWQNPAADTLLLIIFTQDHYDIRFYMGANFRAKGVTVDEMLGMVRSQYFAGVRKGDVAGGLTSLIGAVNQRMSGGSAPAATVVPGATGLTVADPFGGGRHTAAGQVEIAKALLGAYLSTYKAEGLAEASRLKDFRLNDAGLNVVRGSDTDKLVFQVKYDVLPVAANSAWVGSSGVAGKDGWILGRTQLMAVEKVGGVWQLQALSDNL